MRGFGCARESGKIVAWQCTTAFLIERDGWGAPVFLEVMDRPSRQSGGECAFLEAVGVQMCETGHGLSEEIVQFFILETERLGRIGFDHAQFLDDRLVLPPPQEL